AVAGLQSERYQNVREPVESASKYLSIDPPNYRQAWRATLTAAGALFGVMFPYVQLTAQEIERRLRPGVERAYEGDATARRGVPKQLSGVQEWGQAARTYRP